MKKVGKVLLFTKKVNFNSNLVAIEEIQCLKLQKLVQYKSMKKILRCKMLFKTGITMSNNNFLTNSNYLSETLIKFQK